MNNYYFYDINKHFLILKVDKKTKLKYCFACNQRI